jgi:hypothetical protein
MRIMFSFSFIYMCTGVFIDFRKMRNDLNTLFIILYYEFDPVFDLCYTEHSVTFWFVYFARFLFMTFTGIKGLGFLSDIDGVH